MGWISALGQQARDLVLAPRTIPLELQPLTMDMVPRQTFDSAPMPVDRLIRYMKDSEGTRVSRSLALSVSSVQRGRNELAAIATLPLRLYRDNDVIASPLFRQFDPDVPNVVHLAATIEDLALESIAWWQITGRDFSRYPISVKRVDPSYVTLRDPRLNAARSPGDIEQAGRWVWIDWQDGRGAQPFPSADMIRFDSPNPGILSVNARAIRIAVKLDQLTEMYADNPSLREWFTDSDDPQVSPMEDEEIDAFLAGWSASRKVSPTGWIPNTVKHVDATTVNPRDLTLADLRKDVSIAIANGLGVDPEDIGVSTTSRTYFNSVDKKQDKINRTYAPFMSALTDRLSMGDVTMRGYAVRFDLTDYLKSDPVTQAAYWKALQDMGAIDSAEIRSLAGFSGPPPKQPTVPPALPAAPVTSSQFAADKAGFTFNQTDFADAPEAPTVDVQARTITGLATPYNAVANKFGMKYSFKPGSLEYSAPERMAHLMDHGTPVGFHRSVTDSAAGPIVELSVLDGPEGSPAKMQRDQLLYDAANGLYSGLSVGVDFSLDPADGDVEYDEATGVFNIVRATWRETSSTYMPAFDDARVTQVAASREEQNMKCQHCGGAHAPNIACATFAAQLAQTAPATPEVTPATTEQTFTAGPTPVNPHRGPAQVKEPAPYVFDRKGNLRAGSHDFSTDIFNGFREGGGGDKAAADRAQKFIQETFAVTPANVVNLNYPQNKPDMYVDQMEYKYPIWDAVNKGTLDAVTPFVVPKFNTATGLVADHVTGTEPTPGTFTATAQTITPSAVSGKVEITREAWDQGGNPQMSGLIWRQMVRGYYEALEAYAVAQLVANAASITDILITTAAADAALDQSLADGLIPLQYIRGGDRFSRVFTQIDLYKAMVKAKDTGGRRLYPAYGPQNAAGTADPGFANIEAHGKLFIPAWATAATSVNSASSYMFDPEKVCGWASAPQRIDLQWRVAWVDLAIWGYKAFAITDFAGVRELTYDPV